MVDYSSSPLQAISRADLGWVDPKVIGISSTFSTEASVSKFLDKFPVLKADGRSSLFSVEPCLPTESVCMGRSGTDPPFFYLYSCLFSDLHVSLPFDNFIMGVFRTLNVRLPSFTQTHGRPFRSFICYVMFCVFTPLLLLF